VSVVDAVARQRIVSVVSVVGVSARSDTDGVSSGVPHGVRTGVVVATGLLFMATEITVVLPKEKSKYCERMLRENNSQCGP
jgi:hypothetical protein